MTLCFKSKCLIGKNSIHKDTMLIIRQYKIKTLQKHKLLMYDN